MKHYRVWMHIRGGISKPSYDGYVDVWAADEQEAVERAKQDLRRGAHWDSAPEDLRVQRVERLPITAGAW